WKRIDDNYVRVVVPVSFFAGGYAEYYLNSESLDIVRVRLLNGNTDQGEEVEAVLTYSGWLDQDGARLPRQVTISVPRDKSLITLAELKYKVNPKLHPQAFMPGRVKATYPLHTLYFEEPEGLETRPIGD